jgi:hypothetical protein
VKKVRKNRGQTKILGEFGELCFATKATSLGMGVMKPHGDSLPYDFVVDTGERLARVQVKTGGRLTADGRYHVNTVRTKNARGRRTYSPSQIDFLVAYVVPEDAWYVIPVSAIKNRVCVYFFPHQARNRGRFEKYREAWHLLRPHPSPRRISRRRKSPAAIPSPSWTPRAAPPTEKKRALLVNIEGLILNMSRRRTRLRC